MQINFLAIFVATAVQFVIGAVWYMPLFGKIWGQIHGFDVLSKEEQIKAQKQMMPLLAIQFMMGLASVYALSTFLAILPEMAWYQLALWLWVGFMLPVQVSAVMFGGTEQKWIMKKLGVMLGGSFVTFLGAAFILSLF